MTKEYLSGKLLKTMALRVTRIKCGLFNFIIIWGPTRSGKSTLAMKIGYTIARGLGVPFTVKSIYFDTQKMINDCNTPEAKNKVAILDEASFDLLAGDMGNPLQRLLIQFYNIAAKYGQTHILIMPKIFQLKKDFLLDEHAIGYRTSLLYDKQKELYEIGSVRAFNNIDMTKIYDLFKHQQYEKAMSFVGEGWKEPFDNDLSFFSADDLDQYQKNKDAAILTIGSVEKESKTAIEKKRIQEEIDAKTQEFIAKYVSTT